jgi:hypothetical protein
VTTCLADSVRLGLVRDTVRAIELKRRLTVSDGGYQKAWTVQLAPLLVGLWGNPDTVATESHSIEAFWDKRSIGWVAIAMVDGDRDSIVVYVLRAGPGQSFDVSAAFGEEGPVEKAYLAAMKSDLRNMVTAEESYFADHVTYTRDVAKLFYTSSTGVTVTLGTVSGTGYNATAKSTGTSKTCAIYVGSAAAPIAGQNEGEPKCQ